MKINLLTASILASSAVFATDLAQTKSQDLKPQDNATCSKCCLSAKSKKPAKQKCIGKKMAIGIALDNAKVDRTAAKDLKCELETENGILVYEVEFESNGYDYEYDIDAVTGKILKSKKELD